MPSQNVCANDDDSSASKRIICSCLIACAVGGSLSVALAYAMNEKGVSKYWLGSLLAQSESSVSLLFVSSEFLLGMGM